MANRLNIYACTGLKDGNKQLRELDASAIKQMKKTRYYTLGTNTLTNTKAENSLLTRLNCANAELKLTDISKAEKQELMNSVDLYTVCLEVVREYKGNTQLLKDAGVAIGNLISTGAFQLTTSDAKKHADNIATIIGAVEEQVAVMQHDPDEIMNKEFEGWWNEVVLKNNDVFYKETGLVISQKIDEDLIKTVGEGLWTKLFKDDYKDLELKKAGDDLMAQLNTDEYKDWKIYRTDDYPDGTKSSWQNDTDISGLLTQCGKYFIYLYFTDEELKKLPAVFREKRNKQLEIYWFVSDKFVGVYGSQDDLDRIIYTGIVSDTGQTPRKLCSEVMSGVRDPESIGALTMAVVMLIVAGISALVAIISAIINAVARTQEAKYNMILNTEEGAASEDDFNGLDKSSSTKTTRTMLGVAAGLVGIMVLLNSKK